MKQTLIELLDQYKAGRLPIPADTPPDEQSRLFTEGVTVKRSLTGRFDESNSTFPRQLATTLSTNGATYHQVERTEEVAIFEGPQAGMYEVIAIQVKPPGICPSGAVVPWREVYPVAEQWGTYGWTFTSQSHHEPLPAARERAMAMEQAIGNHGKESAPCN